MNAHIARDLETGACAGILATLPMTVAMVAAHRQLPRHERYEMPPEVITREVMRRTGTKMHRRGPVRKFATGLAHLAYGGLAGAVYRGAFGGSSANPAVGLSYGLGVWAVSYLGLMPALGLHEPANRHPWRRNLMMAAAHAVWGLGLARAVRAIGDGSAAPSSGAVAER